MPSNRVVPARLASGVGGSVHGGRQPVSGATVQLYSVGVTGDGSAARPLLTHPVITDANGVFTLTNLYTCTNATQVYLTASGGNPGAASANANLALMTALGPCSGLTANTNIAVNELTTVAGVNALAPYMTGPGAVGSGSSDVAGLSGAFTLAAEYVDPSSGGTPGANVPAGLAVPVTLLNTLADVTSACVNSTGGTAGDSTVCGQFFALTQPPGGAAATDTITALLDLANNPVLNTAALFNLATAVAPFQPVYGVAPPDFHIRMAPAGGQPVVQANPASLSFDSTVYLPTTAQTVTIQNMSSLGVSLSGVGITGANAADFAATPNCGVWLTAGASCSVQVTATPTGAGARSGYLAVYSGAPDSPEYVPLHATATTVSNDQVTLSPASLVLPVNDYLKPLPVTLTNAGAAAVGIGSIAVTSGFTQSNQCGAVLAAQSACTIYVSYDPAGGASTGTLTVTDSTASGSHAANLANTVAPIFTGKRALFVGDSITASGLWPAVFQQHTGVSLTGGNYPGGTERGAYDSAVTYGLNDLVYSGTTYYVSLQGSNAGHSPGLGVSASWWGSAALQADILGNPGHPTNEAYLQYLDNVDANPSGPSVVQQLAAALSNKDMMFLFYGTNDAGKSPGQLGDSAYIGHAYNSTVYSSIEGAVQTALQAIALSGRVIQLTYITPYYQSYLTDTTPTSIAQEVAAIKQVCAEYGIPVIDNTASLNISSLNWNYAPSGQTNKGTYSSGSAYKANDMVWAASGAYYTSLADGNVGNALPVAPATSTAWWTFTSSAPFVDGVTPTPVWMLVDTIHPTLTGATALGLNVARQAVAGR